MNIEIEDLTEGFIGYKAASYEVWNPETYRDHAANDKEWSGLYVAPLESTASGYLVDMVQGGEGIAYIHKVELSEDTRVIVCLDEGFKTGNINMAELKESLRNAGVDVQDDQLLMPRLGALNYFFKCYNNEEGDLEIIVPNVMTDRILMPNYKRCTINDYKVESCVLM
jgi:hypothetical protein